jgi:S1-C subfamily serine protease
MSDSRLSAKKGWIPPIASIVGVFVAIVVMFNALINSHPTVEAPVQRQESFSQVWVSSLGMATECYTLGRLIDCDIALWEDQIRPEEVVNGSSVIVHHDNRRMKTYVVSAHHVCVNDDLRQESVRTGRRGIPIGVRYMWSTSHHLIDIEGQRHDATIFHLDRDNDMCILSSYDIWGRISPVSETDPEIGETVYGISAPEGLFSSHMVPIFRGIYSGRSIGRVPSFNGTGLAMSEIDVHTFTSRPGSSGSGVFNLRGELIGIVHSTVTNVNGVSISSTPQELRDLIAILRSKL